MISPRVVFSLCLAGLLVSHDAVADSAASARAAAKNVVQSVKRLERRFSRLSSTEQAKLLAFLSARTGTYPDSDSDGLPDLLEGGGVCKPDADDDGIPDGAEREVKGRISTATADRVTVAGIAFVVTPATVLVGLTASDLTPGQCVEAKGTASGTGPIQAITIEAEDDCGGTPNRNDDDDKGDDDRGGRGRN